MKRMDSISIVLLALDNGLATADALVMQICSLLCNGKCLKQLCGIHNLVCEILSELLN